MHAHTRAPSGQGRLAPRGRLGHLVADAHVVAQILHMEAKRRLVGQHVYVVMVHMHAVRHLFDDDAALAVADDPMQQRLLLAGHDLGDEGHVLQRLLTSSTESKLRATHSGNSKVATLSVPSTGSCTNSA